MDLSGQFISLSWFLSCDNKNLEQQGVKQQKSYSSVQLKQACLLLDRHSRNMGAGQSQRSRFDDPSWLPPVYTSCLLFFVVPCAKQGLYPPSVKGNANGHMLWPVDNRKLCNSKLCCVCLPIIQSILIRCTYVQDSY